MDELAIPVDTSTMASVGSDDALRTLGGQFDDILAQADDIVKYTNKDTGKLVNKIQEEFIHNPAITKNAQYQELMGRLLGLGDNYTPSQLNMVREKARELINWSTTQKAGISERASRKVFEVLDDFFKESVPQTKEVLAKMRDIYTVRPFLQAKAPSAGTMPLGTASTHIEIPTGGLQERIPSAIGKTLQKGVSLPQGLPKVLEPLVTAGQRAIPAIPGINQGISEGRQIQQPQQLQPQMPQQDQGISAINLMLAQGVLNGQISATEANAVLSLLGMDAKSTQSNLPKTDTGRKAMVARRAAIGAYQLLQESPDVAGKTAGIENLLYGLTGAANQSTAYKSQIEALRSQMFNALGGSSLTPTEKEQYEKFLPKVTDSAARARQKIEQLVPMLEALMGASISSTEILQQY